MTDVLAKALEAIRLRGTVYFKADFRAPWDMSIPSKEIAAFHVVAAGECWLRVDGAKPHRLRAGDIAMLPHGTAHELVHEASLTTLVCGHFEYDHRGLHPFFRSLPTLIHIPANDAEQSSWLEAAGRLAAAESSSKNRGASAVVDRLAEALLLSTLRLYLEHERAPQGFVAAAKDPQIGLALAEIHDQPQRDWTLAELAKTAGLSRTVFASRFRDLVGDTPMRYLSRWRMLTARDLLEEAHLSTAEVAERVGYRSEFAFAKAFKRAFGKGPGQYRRPA
jgi:AraC family transcriptional activator of mtrCDE